MKVKYKNPNDRRMKEYTHMLLALAFVPVQDVIRPTWKDMARGRLQIGAAVLREDVREWNSRSGMTSRSRAKIPSHNLEPVRISVAEKILRCRSRQTPSDLYTALREFQKEQADAESMVGRAQHRKESQSSAEAEMGDHAGAHSISCRELLRLQGQGRHVYLP